jgi:predicted phage terminase large subunit-like protein
MDPRIKPKIAESLLRRLTPKLTPYIQGEPTAKQQLGLCLDNVKEIFWGGAAGGGKSWFLLASCLQYVDVPGYSALIIRKNYPDLTQPGGLIYLSHQWLDGKDCHWSEERKCWTFPTANGGNATIQFGHMDSAGEKKRYKGGAYQTISIDELTDFTEDEAMFLHSRLRRTMELKNYGVPLRFRGASNPGGTGHNWVKRRYIEFPEQGKQVFIPAFLSDNPHIDQVEYRDSLNQLDPVTRHRLLMGDWVVLDGGTIFNLAWWKTFWDVPPVLVAGRVRAWDLAAGVTKDHKETAGVLMSRTNKGLYVIEDVIHGRWAPGERDAVIRATAQRDGEDVAIKIEEEGGSGGVAQNESLIRHLAGFRVESVKVTGDKFYRAGPLASQVQVGNVVMVKGPWNRAFMDQLHAADPENDDLLMDMMDAASLGFNCLTRVTLNPFAVETPEVLHDRSRLTEDQKDALFEEESQERVRKPHDLWDEIVNRPDEDWRMLN